MAEAEIDRLVQFVESRWPEARLVVRHRLGRLAVGEASVAIVATAPHRADAFAACREAIDRLKTTVPIWKKEFYADGSSDWIDPTRIAAPAPQRA
jgi:molybdopterin synthase catalytic subunit